MLMVKKVMMVMRVMMAMMVVHYIRMVMLKLGRWACWSSLCALLMNVIPCSRSRQGCP